MGELAEALAATPRDKGGQKHGLPPILERLDPEVRADLLKALADPETNLRALARIMTTTYGCDAHYTTWIRWAEEIQSGRVFK